MVSKRDSLLKLKGSYKTVLRISFLHFFTVELGKQLHPDVVLLWMNCCSNRYIILLRQLNIVQITLSFLVYLHQSTWTPQFANGGVHFCINTSQYRYSNIYLHRFYIFIIIVVSGH